LAIIFFSMALRRYPWKIARLTDSSFKIFAQEPTPGLDPKKLILSTQPEVVSNKPDYIDNETEGATKQPEKQQQNEAEDPENDSNAQAANPATQAEGHSKKKPSEIIKGPWRLLRLLPRESRHIISHMLEIDPKNRAKLGEVLDDPLMTDTVMCRQDKRAENHIHNVDLPKSEQ
jgi:serine/threonine protein kinase